MLAVGAKRGTKENDCLGVRRLFGGVSPAPKLTKGAGGVKSGGVATGSRFQNFDG